MKLENDKEVEVSHQISSPRFAYSESGIVANSTTQSPPHTTRFEIKNYDFGALNSYGILPRAFNSRGIMETYRS